MRNYKQLIIPCLLLMILTSNLYAENQQAIEFYTRGAALMRDSKGSKAFEAIKDFHSAIDSDPEFKTAYQAIADAYIIKYMLSQEPQKEWLISALEILNPFIEKFPGSGKAYLAKATIFAYLNKQEKADREFKKALLSMPDNSETYSTYFSFLIENEKISSAQSLAEKTRNKQINDPSLYCFYAEQFLQIKSFDEAIENAEYALTIDKQYLPALLVLGDIFQAQKKFQKALEKYQEAISISDAGISIYFKIGLAYAGLAQYNNAIDATQKYIDKYPDDISALYNMAMYYEKAMLKDKAYKIWESILNSPEVPERYKQKAKEYLNLNS